MKQKTPFGPIIRTKELILECMKNVLSIADVQGSPLIMTVCLVPTPCYKWILL